MKELFDEKTKEQILHDANAYNQLIKLHPEYKAYAQFLSKDCNIKPVFEVDPKTSKRHCAFIGVFYEGKCFGIGMLAFAYKQMVEQQYIKNEWLSWLANISVVTGGRLAYVGNHGRYRLIDPYEIMQMFLGFHLEWYDEEFDENNQKN